MSVQRVAPQIIRRLHPFSTISLELVDVEHRATAAGNVDPPLPRLQDGAGGSIGGLEGKVSGKDFTADAAELRHRSGPGQQAPDLVVERPGRFAPVHG